MDRTRVMDRLVFAALLGVSSIAVVEFLQFPTLYAALTISLLCFSLTIPLLAMGTFMVVFISVYRFPREPLWFGALQVIGELAAVVGLGALVWHLYWVAGFVLVGTSLVAFVACASYTYSVRFYERKDRPRR